MKYVPAFLFVFILSIGAFPGFAQKALPSIPVQTLEGQTFDMQSLANDGRPTIISFWATWCAPCKKELDAISEVYKSWQAAYEVELAAVSIDNRRMQSRVAPMVQSHGWPYLILFDPEQKSMQALKFNSIPQTLLLDRSGNVIYSHNGYSDGDEKKLEAKLKMLK